LPDLGMLRLEVPGDAFAHCPRHTGARTDEGPDRHVSERTRRYGLTRTVPGMVEAFNA
jgi:hypothetical protein